MPAVDRRAEEPSDLAEIGLENFAPYLMNRIMGRYNADLRREMAALGLTTAKMRALAILSVEDGLSIGVLGVYAVVEQSTLSRALDALADDGLIRRALDRNDHRSSRIFLTPAGRVAYRRFWPVMSAGHDRMFNGIDETERQAFLATLRKMLANIRVHDF